MEYLDDHVRICLWCAPEGFGEVSLVEPDERACGLVDVADLADASACLLFADVSGGRVDELLYESPVGKLDLCVGAGGVGETGCGTVRFCIPR